MALKTYTVLVSRLGVLRNREAVEAGAMEGRVIQPLVDYVEKGKSVKLDPASDATKRALDRGSIEEPGAADIRRAEELKAEMDALKVRQDALAAQMPSAPDATGDKGPSLADLQAEAEALGIAKSGNKAELSERITAHKDKLAAAT